MKHKVYFVAVFLAIILCGCSSEPPFRQSVENIAKIELVKNQYASHTSTLLCTLTGTTSTDFMTDLLEFDCIKRHPPSVDIGEYEIRVYYNNGDVDFIGSEGNGFIEQGETYIPGWYRYSDENLKNLFEKYATFGQESAT